ncbi:hypothetical protein [Hyphomicrobium sp. DY-1]|uniref:hypothetical protein n=1 Tax=Hyphomicrobium sp. DY-1 TaxID=3075650 RepID=UPI0039C317F9
MRKEPSMPDTPTPPLILFFIADNPSVDANRDLFTWAHSADQAVDDWRKNYETHDRPDGVCAIPTTTPRRGVVPWDIIRTEALS